MLFWGKKKKAENIEEAENAIDLEAESIEEADVQEGNETAEESINIVTEDTVSVEYTKAEAETEAASEETEAASEETEAESEEAPGTEHSEATIEVDSEAIVAPEDTDNAMDDGVTDAKDKVSLFTRLKNGLAKTRNSIVSNMDSLFSQEGKIDDDFYDELEEILILGDIGVRTTDNIIERLKKQVKEEHIKKRDELKKILINNIKEEMSLGEAGYEYEHKKSIVFVIGVNGVGKTTSIGKLASHLKAMGLKVNLAACDTFRAAAGSQLEEWSHRAGVPMIGGAMGQDPASVLYDAVTSAKARDIDVLLVDTAGRLHNKKNLMEELKKMNKIIDREYPDAHRENLIVLDASTGQNALNQAREFGEVANLTGIILTKMDGTAKGGIAIAVQGELGIPVKYIGVGEKIEDLQKFDSDKFVDALFDVWTKDIDNSNEGDVE